MIRILVVDDDKLIRWSLKEILSHEGYEVDAVATARDALTHVENTNYNLIFCDIDVDEENGIEILKKLLVVQPEAKTIILSAHSRNQIEPQLENLNILSIIEKPFQSEQIRSIVKDVLE
ncbi:MAG: response regulator [Candidatus Aminicenantes bacterium]|nr:MAG: response regulator [Candidatus Aminicenantes bacterium]